MNLRILKKLSKRAAALIKALGCEEEQFRAEAGENYHKSVIRDRKCWERNECHPTYKGIKSEGDIVFKTRAGRSMVMRPPSHPRKGTIMVGATTGYYEPEWDEETAWDWLKNCVFESFTDYGENGDGCTLLRPLKTPSDIFRAARDLSLSSEQRKS